MTFTLKSFICFFILLSFSFALTPPSLFDTSWEDQSIFKRDLVPDWQGVTDTLIDAPIYHMRLSMSQDLSTIIGEQEVLISNTTGQVLNELVFRLYPNALGSSLQVSRVELNGVLALTRLEPDATVLRIFLPQPFEVNEKLVLHFNFNAQIGQGGESYGRLGLYNEVLSLAHAYPMLAVFQEGDWLTDTPSPLGDPVVSDAAYYLVELTAPSSTTLVATGTMLFSDIQDSQQLMRFVSGPAREFYVAVAKDMVQLSQVVAETVVHVFVPERFLNSAEQSLAMTSQALELFSEFTAYPYRELDIVAVPVQASGIEFPGVFILANRLFANPLGSSLESVLVHETAHQWSYNLVGSDQVVEPWLDEALAQYLTYLYLKRFKTDSFVEGYLGYWQSIWQNAPDAQEAIGDAVADYDPNTYGAIVYGRGLFFFLELADIMGEDTLRQGLTEYYQTYAWRFAVKEDLKRSLEQSCACSLTRVFEDWVGAP